MSGNLGCPLEPKPLAEGAGFQASNTEPWMAGSCSLRASLGVSGGPELSRSGANRVPEHEGASLAVGIFLPREVAGCDRVAAAWDFTCGNSSCGPGSWADVLLSPSTPSRRPALPVRPGGVPALPVPKERSRWPRPAHGPWCLFSRTSGEAQE